MGGRVASLNLTDAGASGPLDVISPLTALSELILLNNTLNGASKLIFTAGVRGPPAQAGRLCPCTCTEQFHAAGAFLLCACRHATR